MADMMNAKREMEQAAVDGMNEEVKKQKEMKELLDNKHLAVPTNMDELIEVATQLKLNAEQMDTLKELSII